MSTPAVQPGGSLASSEPGLTGADDGLGSISDLQFREDVGDVIADGHWTQLEALGNLGVGLVLGDIHIGAESVELL